MREIEIEKASASQDLDLKWEISQVKKQQVVYLVFHYKRISVEGQGSVPRARAPTGRQLFVLRFASFMYP
jgi:hypothetical protein